MGLLALLLEIARYRDREAETEWGCWHWNKIERYRDREAEREWGCWHCYKR